MEDLIGKAHAYLDNKGCKSMGQQYTAFEIEKMLADFAQQQLNLLTIPAVVGQSEQLPPIFKTDKEYKDVMKVIYPKDNSKRF